MKNILLLVLVSIILFALWWFGVIDSTIALLGMFGAGAGSVVKQKKDDVKEKKKEVDKVLKKVEDLNKRYEEEVKEREETVDDMSLDDLLDSANDRIRRNRTGQDLEE